MKTTVLFICCILSARSSLPIVQSPDIGETDKVVTISTIRIEPYVVIHKEIRDHYRYEGYIIDLVRELSRDMGFKFKIFEVEDGQFGFRHNGNWNGMIGEVIGRRVDLAAAPLLMTKPRMRAIDFTEPFMKVYASLLINKQASEVIKNYKDLSLNPRFKCGVQAKGILRRALKLSNDSSVLKIWKKMLKQHEKGAKYIFTKNNERGIKNVRMDKNYAFVIPSPIADYMQLQMPCNLKAVDKFLMNMDYAFAARKNSSLIPTINKSLRKFKKSGYLDRLRKKWWEDRSQCSSARSSKREVLEYNGKSTAVKGHFYLVLLPPLLLLLL